MSSTLLRKTDSGTFKNVWHKKVTFDEVNTRIDDDKRNVIFTESVGRGKYNISLGQ